MRRSPIPASSAREGTEARNRFYFGRGRSMRKSGPGRAPGAPQPAPPPHGETTRTQNFDAKTKKNRKRAKKGRTAGCVLTQPLFLSPLVLPKKEGANINGLMGLYARHTTATACYCLLCCLSCTCATRCRVLALPPAPLPSHGPSHSPHRVEKHEVSRRSCSIGSRDSHDSE